MPRAFNTQDHPAVLALHSAEATLRKTILLFLKFPEPGQVKTRLAATVGAATAAQIYRRMVARVISALPRDADATVLFDPPQRAAAMREWLHVADRSFRFVPQSEGDLGARLAAGFADAFATGAQQVAAIGGDCIDLTPATFDAAWRALDDADVVIGPTTDGGYYLIASRRLLPLFHPITWSSPRVLAQTLALAQNAGLRVHLLGTLDDIDTADDWSRAQARLPD